MAADETNSQSGNENARESGTRVQHQQQLHKSLVLN
jgi:hypothetical protein